MNCRQCGSPVDPSDKFCPNCGAKVNVTATYQGDDSRAGKSKGPLVVVLVIVLFAIFVALAALLFIRSDVKNEDKEVKVTEEKQEAEQEEETEAASTEEEKKKEEPLSLKKISVSEFDSSAYSVVSVKESEVEGANNISQSKYQSSKEKNYTYEGYKAMDGQAETSWQFDHAPGTLTVSFEKERNIRAISFKLGNWREDKGPTFRYNQNCRPKQIQVSMGSGLKPFAINFDDEKKENVIEFSRAVPAQNIEFNINSYYQGNETNDICIAEITFYEE